jgi:hypothetical protein
MSGLVNNFFDVVGKDIFKRGVVIAVKVKVVKRFLVANIKDIALK